MCVWLPVSTHPSQALGDAHLGTLFLVLLVSAAPAVGWGDGAWGPASASALNKLSHLIMQP